MMEQEPEECADMAELREQIDALDRALVAQLARRAAYIDRAVTLKRQAGLPARIESRVAEVIDNAAAEAAARDLDPELIRRLWRELVEWSIAREEAKL